MIKTITKNLLKHAVGTAMFCPVCKTVLDWAKAVEVDFIAKDTGDPFKIILTCSGCHDAKVGPMLEGASIKLGDNVRIDIIDGRTL